jgi:hypothetical protein
MVALVMATAEFGEDNGVDELGRPPWAWPTTRVTEQEDEAWVELEARLGLGVTPKKGES